MEKKCNIGNAIFILIFGFSIISLTGTVSASGEYDGVWVGPETVSIPGYGSIDETTGTVFYQENEDTLHFWDPLFGPVELVKSDNDWVLPSPLTTTFQGYNVKVTSVLLTFPSANYLTGDIIVDFIDLDVIATGTLSHTRQSCEELINGSTKSNLSGSEGSVRCYEINLPAGATDFDIQTSGGSGDCDLLLVYYRPDFNSFFSENSNNQEQILLSSPESGKWFIGLLGFKSYSGLNLSTTFAGVAPPEIESRFSANLYIGDAPLTVTFTDESEGSITTWEWEFGDGAASMEQNPEHTYAEPGIYSVTLTVTGPGGTDTRTKNSFIEAQEVADSDKAMPWLNLLLLNMDQ